MELMIFILGIVLFLIGAYLHNTDKNSTAGWWFMGIGVFLWGGSIY